MAEFLPSSLEKSQQRQSLKKKKKHEKSPFDENML